MTSVLAGRPVFCVAGRTHTRDEVILAAAVWGSWAALEREVRDGFACLQRLEEFEDEEEGLPEAEVAAAAAEFRYARDLVAAEDMEAWLETRGLNVGDWMDYIQRTLLLKKWAADLETIRQEYAVDSEEVQGAILGDAVCGGHAATWAAQLAARAAAHAKMTEDEGDAAVPEAAVSALLPEVAAAAEALAPLGMAYPEDTVAWLARLEAAWRQFTARHITAAALRDQLHAHRLDWTRLRVRVLFLADPEAAREAALCIREDGRDPAEVAADAGADFRVEDWYLDEAEPGLRDHLLAARGGEVIGPLPLQGGFAVVAVLAKEPPSGDDPGILARAEHALLDRAVRREVESRVRWSQTW